MAYATTGALATEAKSRREQDKVNADAIAALSARASRLESDMANVVLRISKLEGSVTLPPVYVPPPPDAIPPPVSGRVISPTGSDSTGTGSTANPWKTLGKFYATAGPGDALYCRGGTYSNTPDGTVNSVSGTAAAPITVTAYPGEVPLFRGTGSAINYALAFTIGSSYHVVDGLCFENFYTPDNSIIGLGQGTGVARGITIRNCKLTLFPTGGLTDHCVYFSRGSDRITVEGCLLIGAGTGRGSGCQVYHTPGSTNFLIQRNIFVGFGDRSAIKVADVDATGQILHNTFSGNTSPDMDVRQHGPLLIRNNASDNPAGLYDPTYSARTSADHNFWSQSFVSGTTRWGVLPYHLDPASSGHNAASDGTDAGALA